MSSPFLILGLVALYLFAWWSWQRYQRWRQRTQIGVELGDPFFAEVLLDGVPVATLTDRVVTEMFWRSYHLNPLPGAEAQKITSEELWTIPCHCTFRDPATGSLCKSAWTSHGPRMADGVLIVHLRNLFFKPEKN